MCLEHITENIPFWTVAGPNQGQRSLHCLFSTLRTQTHWCSPLQQKRILHRPAWRWPRSSWRSVSRLAMGLNVAEQTPKHAKHCATVLKFPQQPRGKHTDCANSQNISKSFKRNSMHCLVADFFLSFLAKGFNEDRSGYCTRATPLILHVSCTLRQKAAPHRYDWPICACQTRRQRPEKNTHAWHIFT